MEPIRYDILYWLRERYEAPAIQRIWFHVEGTDLTYTDGSRELWVVREGEEMPRPSFGPAIEDFLRRAQPAYHTTAEIAEAVGCTAQVVARHLSSNSNVLSRVRESDGPGRPPWEYGLAVRPAGRIQETRASQAARQAPIRATTAVDISDDEGDFTLEEFDPEAIEMELFGDLSFDWSEDD